MSQPIKIVIVGGVAGGASAAARARRMSEDATIVLLERSPYISFANCGMPYHIGGIIQDRSRLLVQTVEAMQNRFRIDVRVNTEVTRIDRANKQVHIRNVTTQTTAIETYDILILSPGAEPIRPALPGIDLPNIFTLRTLEDMDRIITAVAARPAQRALVVGGGFIGLEMAEAFREKGLAVTLVEMAPQVMSQLDAEMAFPIHQQLSLQGVELKLGISVNGFTTVGNLLRTQLSSGETLDVNLVVLAIGVKPENKLAKESGLELGERQGIRVNEHMQTSDPAIYAVGDAIETQDIIAGVSAPVPLAGPANRQGRIAADHALGNTQSAYRGSQGTSICKIFDLSAGSTGLNERTLKRLGMDYEKIYVHPASHAGYYPGAVSLSMKLLFHPKSGKLLGAQLVGADGVDKRLDVLATALRAGLTVYDLEHLELAYAPPYGSAKDPVNYAGFVAANVLRGDMHLCQVSDVLTPTEKQLLLDVRTPAEVKAGTIPGAVNIPLDSLRERLAELPRNKELLIFCQVGLRSYLASRILSQKGWTTRVLTGGYTTYKAITNSTSKEVSQPKREIKHDANESQEPVKPPIAVIALQIDARGLQCPGPIIQLGRAIEQVKPGEAIQIQVTDAGFLTDAPAWCRSTGHRCLDIRTHAGYYEAVVVKESPEPTNPTPTTNKKNKTFIVFSNDFDRVMSAFILANGSAAMGSKVTLFFTFWGLNVLRKPGPTKVSKDILERMFGWMMPQGPTRLTLSKMNMGGLGTRMMQFVMRRKCVTPLPELMQQAKTAGVKLVACAMTMDIMGIKREELIDGVELGGVASYLEQAENSGLNLFI